MLLKLYTIFFFTGKWLTVASSEKYELFWVFDYYHNFYFIKKDGCDSYMCESNDLSAQQLFVLVNDSLKEDSPRPRRIKGVVDKDEAIELRISEENKLFIRLQSGSTAILKTINERDKTKSAQELVTEDSLASEANSTSLIYQYELDLTDPSENDIIPLSSRVAFSVHEQNKDNVSIGRRIRRGIFEHINASDMIHDCLRQINPNGKVGYKFYKQMSKKSLKSIPWNEFLGSGCRD